MSRPIEAPITASSRITASVIGITCGDQLSTISTLEISISVKAANTVPRQPPSPPPMRVPPRIVAAKMRSSMPLPTSGSPELVWALRKTPPAP